MPRFFLMSPSCHAGSETDFGYTEHVLAGRDLLTFNLDGDLNSYRMNGESIHRDWAPGYGKEPLGKLQARKFFSREGEASGGQAAAASLRPSSVPPALVPRAAGRAEPPRR
ncbi:unnamed protein product, partial [Coccothraustes coccothraustes]